MITTCRMLVCGHGPAHVVSSADEQPNRTTQESPTNAFKAFAPHNATLEAA